jgi:hypothetical protein
MDNKHGCIDARAYNVTSMQASDYTIGERNGLSAR